MSYFSLFQSTHPARGATQTGGVDYICQIISIHAPREGCAAAAAATSTTERFISIHAPREGCDPLVRKLTPKYARFQSTHPARGATPSLWLGCSPCGISIHAPREGCDPTAGRGRYLRDNFNPRTPRGVRLAPHAGGGAAILISIHAPREGCDFAPRNDGGMWVISIHAPREGCDHYEPILPCRWCNFNPRTPRGVRHSWYYASRRL